MPLTVALRLTILHALVCTVVACTFSQSWQWEVGTTGGHESVQVRFPHTMFAGDSGTVELLTTLEMPEPIDATRLRKRFRLRSAGFEIEPGEPIVRTIAPGESSFKWTIRPKSAGSQVIILTAETLDSPDISGLAPDYREQTLQIDVRTESGFPSFVYYLAALVAAVLLAVFGYEPIRARLMPRRRRRARRE